MRGRPSRFDKTLRSAIAQKRRIVLWYDGYLRDVEPHDYGIHKGEAKVLCYQVGGGSRSGRLPEWRLFIVSKISEAKASDEPFGGQRSVPGDHLEWDELFASVSRRPFGRAA